MQYRRSSTRSTSRVSFSFLCLALGLLGYQGNATAGEPSDDSVAEAAVEQVAIGACHGKVSRHDGHLSITALGKTVLFDDLPSQMIDQATYDGPWDAYRLVECNDRLGLIVVQAQHWEWGEFILIDTTTGWSESVPGPIHASPSGSLIAIMEQEPSGVTIPRGMQVLSRDPTNGWQKVWEFQAHRDVIQQFNSWDGNGRFVVDMVTFSSSGLKQSEKTTFEVSSDAFRRVPGRRSASASSNSLEPSSGGGAGRSLR